MDFAKLVQMIANMFLCKAVNVGVKKGIDVMARRGKAPAQMTAAEHEQARKARDLVKTARKAARVTRRIGR